MSLELRIRINYPFFLHCQNFTELRKCLLNELTKIDSGILTLDEKSFTKLLLYGDGRYDSKTNKSIILASIKFVIQRIRNYGNLMSTFQNTYFLAKILIN